MQRYKYQVQSYRNENWMNTPFAGGTLSYCRGWVDAMDSLYPSPRYRIAEFVDGDLIRVVHETTGRAAAHTNA